MNRPARLAVLLLYMAFRGAGTDARLLYDLRRPELLLTGRAASSFVRGHRQLTDVYLLGLPHKTGGRLATFDRDRSTP